MFQLRNRINKHLFFVLVALMAALLAACNGEVQTPISMDLVSTRGGVTFDMANSEMHMPQGSSVDFGEQCLKVGDGETWSISGMNIVFSATTTTTIQLDPLTQNGDVEMSSELCGGLVESTEEAITPEPTAEATEEVSEATAEPEPTEEVTMVTCALISVGVDETTALTPEIVEKDYFGPHRGRCHVEAVNTHQEAEEILVSLFGEDAIMDMVHNPDPRVQTISVKPDNSDNPGACYIPAGMILEASIGKGYIIGTRNEITPNQYQEGLAACPVP